MLSYQQETKINKHTVSNHNHSNVTIGSKLVLVSSAEAYCGVMRFETTAHPYLYSY